MEATYNYQTGKITRDFKIVRVYYKENGCATCKLSGLPCYVDSSRCKQCSHYGGLISPLIYRINGFYIRCDHPDQKDSENIGPIIYAYEEKLKQEALIAYYD